MSRVVSRPPSVHACRPGCEESPGAPGGPLAGMVTISPPWPPDFPRGTVWECDCGQRLISRGMAGGGRSARGGYWPAELVWEREGRFARWRRLRKEQRDG